MAGFLLDIHQVQAVKLDFVGLLQPQRLAGNKCCIYCPRGIYWISLMSHDHKSSNGGLSYIQQKPSYITINYIYGWFIIIFNAISIIKIQCRICIKSIYTLKFIAGQFNQVWFTPKILSKYKGTIYIKQQIDYITRLC